MKEYIERNTLIMKLENRRAYLVKEYGYRDHYVRGYDECVDTVKNSPTTDVSPVRHGRHGRWEPEDNIFDDSTWICSACHEPWVLIDGTPQDNNMNYCPNCGAMMDLTE